MSGVGVGGGSEISSKRPIVLTCALTGVAADRNQCPYLPYTPREIAEEALRAYNEGATVVHIHGREDDGRPSWRVPIFQEIRNEVRKRCPILINFSTGGIGNTIAERTEPIEHAVPDIAALNMGSMNYAVYSKKNRKFYFDEIFANPFKDIITALVRMNRAGVTPEMECFDLGHISNAEPLVDMGLLKPPFHFSLVMGVVGGIAATSRNLKFMSESLPPGSHWQVIGISRNQWSLCEESLTLGGNVRVGLEDNFYLPDGKTMARSNGELAKAAVKMVEQQGFRVANLSETKGIFSRGL